MNVLRKEMAHSHKIGYNNYTLESELKKNPDESLNVRADIYNRFLGRNHLKVNSKNRLL